MSPNEYLPVPPPLSAGEQNLQLQDSTFGTQGNPQYSISKIPAHTHNKTDSPQVNFKDLVNKTRWLMYRAVDSATNDSAATLGGSWVAPFSGQILTVGATVDTAGVTGTMTIDIKKGGTTIMANVKINIGTTQTDSRNYTTSTPLITTPIFYTKDIFTFVVTAVQTTPAKGLTVWMQLVEVGT